MAFGVLAGQITVIFLEVLLGYVGARSGIIKDRDSKFLSDFIMRLLLPCTRLAVLILKRTFYFVQIADDCQHRRHVLIKALFRVSHFTGSLGDGEIQRQAVRCGGGVQLQRIAAAGVEP